MVPEGSQMRIAKNIVIAQVGVVACIHATMRKQQKTKKDWSCAAYPPQRSLRAALGCRPTTAGGAQFCLLCCQPGPVPESLPARPPVLTPRRPCRPPVWLGHPIHTAGRTYHGPQRFISQVPMRGTGRHDSPQRRLAFSRASRNLTFDVRSRVPHRRAGWTERVSGKLLQRSRCLI